MTVKQNEATTAEDATPLAGRENPFVQAVKDFKIGRKLTIGFSLLVGLTLLIVGLSYVGSRPAVVAINRTEEVRAPTTLASTSAQANLLRMLANVREYLAFPSETALQNYNEAQASFETDLDRLEAQRDNLDPLDQYRLDRLQEAFSVWTTPNWEDPQWGNVPELIGQLTIKPTSLPELLFALRNEPLVREPAYKLVAVDATSYAGEVLIATQELIASQANAEPNASNVAILADMASFQASFASMLSGLRNYVTTQNRIYRQEYEVSLSRNEEVWDRLQSNKLLLTPVQQGLLEQIARNRADFLDLPEAADEAIFPILEENGGAEARQDLKWFNQEAVPLNTTMLSLLDELTIAQQSDLESDLNQGRVSLDTAVQQTITFGLIAVAVGIVSAVLLRAIIAGPVLRLTDVAEQIRGGNLEAQAKVESGDEIGILAHTFNNMTARLKEVLFQVRKEKKRADDLLNVVIPIGIQLSSEKDFNRLLENMLTEAKQFCHALGGILYLRTEQELQPMVVQNDALDITMGGVTGQDIAYPNIPLYDGERPRNELVPVQAAVSSQTINIADVGARPNQDATSREIGYDAISCLAIPLIDSENEVAGVLQLLDARDPETRQVVPFDQNLQQMMESFSSLAVAALEAYIREQALRQEIRQLRIEIDEAKQKQQVEEITGTDFFQELQTKARQMRRRSRETRNKGNE